MNKKTGALKLVLKIIKNCRPLAVLSWLSLPFFPLFCLFFMDIMNFGGQIDNLLRYVEAFPGSVLFECLVVLLVFLVLLFVCRSAALAAGLFGTLSFVCCYVNYTKVALNGDHFMPQDILFLSHASNLASFISGALPGWFFIGVTGFVVWMAFLLIMRPQLPLRGYLRLPAALAIALCIWSSCSNIDRADALLNRFGMSVFDSALQSSNYEANGFVGAFTINMLSLNVQEPAGYTRELVTGMLSGYDAVPADETAEQFDVIVVLSESFFDARILPGVTFSQNPLPNYDRLLKHPRCYSGSLFTTAIGGGTIRPEFSVLTGLTCDYVPSVPTPYRYISQPFSTYVSNYRDAGYRTTAIHPYNKQFYSRDDAYGTIGFDSFLGQEDLYRSLDVDYKRGYITDDTTFRAIRDCADASDAPTFLFAITMQNHQPYDGIDPSLVQIQVASDQLSEPALTALTTYTQGLYDADKMLGDLADWIDGRDRPTVLVFFGDHMPTLGANYLAYEESGLFTAEDGLTGEELQTMYSTPFLIYSNRELPPGLFGSNRDNRIADYNLLNAVALSTGFARTPYMELLRQFHALNPIYNIRLELPVTEDILPFVQAMEYITYDRVFGKNHTG